MPQNKHETFTEHDMEVVQRLTEVETRLEVVEGALDDFRSHNDRRLDDLTALLTRPTLAEKVLFGVGDFIKENWKTIVAVLLVVTGVGAKALDILK